MTKENFFSSIQYKNLGGDVSVQFEAILSLMSDPKLLGFYISLIWMYQIGLDGFLTQKKVAELLGISKPTFIKYKNSLKKLGLIEIEDSGRGMVLRLKNFTRVKNFYPPKETRKLLKYIDDTRKSLRVKGGNRQQNLLSHAIYTTTIPNTDTPITSTPSTVGANTRYPAEDYKIVIDGYMKYKGVRVAGPEQGQARRAIKTMFKAGRKVKEILDFMKWLSDNQDNPELVWVKTWTLWTVQKKMPEFVAGKLKQEDKLEENFEMIK